MNDFDTVIWDFNGTLLDDVGICMDSVNTLLRRRGLKTLGSVAEYHAVFRFPVIDYYRAVGFDIGEDGSGYDPIAHEWVREYLSREKDIGLYPGARETLGALKDAWIRQAIVSATEYGMLMSQLDRLGVTELFDGVVGTGDIYASSKIEAAKKWASGRDLSFAVMIGDTPHDMDTAAALRVPFAAVSWGHAAREAVPDGVPVFDDFREIREYLKV